jgi:MscS family membrane protein
LLSDIMRLAKKLGVHFAFPTRTVHLFNEQAAPTQQELAEPTETGKQLAADIVGELPDQIPGPVKF